MSCRADGGGRGTTTSGCFLNFIQLIIQPKYSKGNTFRRSSLISCCPVSPITWWNSSPPRTAMGTYPQHDFFHDIVLASAAFTAVPQKSSSYSRKALLYKLLILCLETELKYSNKICAYLLTVALNACNRKHLPDNTKHFPKHFLIGKAF